MLSFISSLEIHDTCYWGSGCSILPWKWMRGEGSVPFIHLLPVDMHSWGNETSEMQDGKCFGTLCSLKERVGKARKRGKLEINKEWIKIKKNRRKEKLGIQSIGMISECSSCYLGKSSYIEELKPTSCMISDLVSWLWHTEDNLMIMEWAFAFSEVWMFLLVAAWTS